MKNESRKKQTLNCVFRFFLLLLFFCDQTQAKAVPLGVQMNCYSFFLSFFSLANLIVSVPDASIFVTGTLRSVFAPMDYVLYVVVVKTVIILGIYEHIL